MTPTRLRRHEVLVIGAGIAGLTAAWDLRDRDVLVLESSERVGGRILSESRGTDWLNFGAHVFSGPGSETDRLVQETGVRSIVVPGTLTGLAVRGRLLTSGRVETLPFRLPLTLRERAGLITSGIRLRRFVAAYDRAVKPRSGEDASAQRARTLAFMNDRTFADFLGQVPPIVDDMFHATVARSSAEPAQLAAGHGIGYFHLVWRKGEGLSRGIVGGSSRLTEALAAGLSERVVTGAHVTSVAPSPDAVTTTFEVGGQTQQVDAEHVIVATPAYVTHKIVRDLPESLDAALRAIPYGPYVVVSFLTNEAGTRPWDGAYAIGTPGNAFNMIFNIGNVARAAETQGVRRPGGSLMVYSGGASLALPMLELEDGAIISRYIDGLERILPTVRTDIQEAVVQRWEKAIPYPAPGRASLQPALETRLPRVHLAGDYLGTWYTETAIQTGASAAVLARAGLAGHEHVGTARRQGSLP